IPSASALACVGAALDHGSWEVRRVAAEVLGSEGSDDALRLLRARLERESDAAVREAIMLALAGPGYVPASGGPGSGAESA
ncbi:MAG TPA: HEAT repeat domain-containing protein, partial [Polyangiaceae bacterium]